MVNEKQHFISLSVACGSMFFSTHVVNTAFCVVSNAIAPKFSQYMTKLASANSS